MAAKSKFQISKLLNERIKKILDSSKEVDADFFKLDSAYILGFNCGNVTSYLGLTADHQSSNCFCPIVGLFFKQCPTDEEVRCKLKQVSNQSGSFKSDKNENLFLIYSQDEEGKPSTRLFDTNLDKFLDDNFKLSVLDEVKIYQHSALVKVCLPLKMDICLADGSLLDGDKLGGAIGSLEGAVFDDMKAIKMSIRDSNYSTTLANSSNDPTENLYDSLEAPVEVMQALDYLPNVSKNDKAEAIKKWRNKVKSQREPLEFRLEHEHLSCDNETEKLPANIYLANLEFYVYIQVNDAISKTIKVVQQGLRGMLKLAHQALIRRPKAKLEPGELKFCTFKPAVLGHLVSNVYPIPSESRPDFELLKDLRRALHEAYLAPLDRPEFRFSQRILNPKLQSSDELAGYLCNVHMGIADNSSVKGGIRDILTGTYTYHHYLQDRATDSGWGCAYRSLQSIISWFKHQGLVYSADVPVRGLNSTTTGDDNRKMNELRLKLHKEARTPTHEEIQAVLVDVGDKPASFIGSHKWIGSQEVCYVLNHLYQIDSKFISVSSGSELIYKARDLGQHLRDQSTPVMIGGGVLAHTIIGVDFNEKNGDISYLILDPHYTGSEDLAVITKKGWCGWKKNNFWDKSAFYNLCLPQRPVEY